MRFMVYVQHMQKRGLIIHGGKHMVRQLFPIALLLISGLGFAACPCASSPKGLISFPLVARTWVQTDSANVTVHMTASVQESDVSDVQKQMMAALKRFDAQADWHVMSMAQSLSDSGLLTVEVKAQARLKGDALNDLNSKAKAFSKPGVSYQIDGVDFKPSFAELQTAQSQLRMSIYQQAQAEIKTLSQTFNEPVQLKRLSFGEKQSPSPLANRALMLTAMNSAPSSMPVAQLMTGSATATFALSPAKSSACMCQRKAADRVQLMPAHAAGK